MTTAIGNREATGDPFTQEQFQRKDGMGMRMELDLQRMGVESVQPATTDYSFGTFCA